MSRKHASESPYVQPYRYPSPTIPLTVIRRFARRIAERFQPEKIILFGSYAYGEPHNESDVDLLVIMPAANELDQSLRLGEEFEWPFALDLIVKTPQKVEHGLREGDGFLCEVLQKGKVLYEASHRPMAAQGRGRSGQRKKP